MPNNVRVGLGVNGAAKAGSELDKFRDKFTNLQKTTAKGFALGVGVAVTQKAFNLAGQAIGQVTGFLEDSAKAYMEEQRSVQQLTTSLKANVPAWNGNSAAIEEQIRASEKLGFQDDDLRQSLALLVAATHDVPKAFQIQSVAMDLARFKGISLQDATEALTRVESGSYRILKSLGIVLKDGATQTEALAAVERVASGQAADFAQTLEGKLAVAEVKVHDAQEKFGKSLARLEADVIPAAADAVTALADTFDGLQTQLDPSATLLEKVNAAIAALESTNAGFLPGGKELLDLLKKQRDALDLAARSSQGLSHWSGRLADDFASGASQAVKFGGSINTLAFEAKGLDSAFSELAGTIENQLFGKAINAGNEAQFRQNIADLVKQRSEVKRGSREWTILTGQINENRQALFELQLQEAQKAGPNALLAFLAHQKTLFGKADVAANQYLDTLIAIAKKQQVIKLTNFGGLVYTGVGGHASGGSISAGEPAIVGEKGPELIVPKTGVDVIPNGQWGGGSMTVNINVSTPALTPGGAEALARHIGPYLTRYQQRTGQLARA